MDSKTYRAGRPVHPATTAQHLRSVVAPAPLRCEAPVRRQWFHDKDSVARCPRRGTAVLQGRLYCVQHARALQLKLDREPWPWPKAETSV
jgi:hypothetical protein